MSMRRSSHAATLPPTMLARALVRPMTILLTATTALALLLTAQTLLPSPTPPATTAPSNTAAPTFVAIAAPTGALARPVPIALPAPPRALALARLIYQPGAVGVRQSVPGPLLLVVEAGALVARLETSGRIHRASAADPSALGECLGACRLGVGDSLLLPATIMAAMQSGGSGPALVLAAGVFPAALTPTGVGRAAAPRWDAAWSPGANVTPLAGGWTGELDSPTATLTLARRTLAPGEEATLAAGGGQALAVETGALTLTTDNGVVWLQHPAESDEWLGAGTAATVLVGESALFWPGASARVRNDGSSPLQLLVLTVMPDAAAVLTIASTGTVGGPLLVLTVAPTGTVGGQVSAEPTRADARPCAGRRGTSRWTVDCAAVDGPGG